MNAPQRHLALALALGWFGATPQTEGALAPVPHLAEIGQERGAASNSGEERERQRAALDADVLVARLNDPQFLTRERAAGQLLELGMAAESALRAGLQSPNAETRERCEVILDAILVNEHMRRLAEFEADLDGNSGHGLPGWETYAKNIGADRAARRLFSEMQRDGGVFLRYADEDPKRAGERVAAFLDSVFSGLIDGAATSRPGTVAAVFYASSLAGADCDERTLELLEFIAETEPFATVATEGDLATPARQVLNGWLDRNGARAPSYQNIHIAMRFRLPAGLPIAERVIAKKNNSPDERRDALLLIGLLGKEEHRQQLIALLDDSAPTTQYVLPHGRFEVQVRDVALAVLIHLSGLDPKDFGFVNRERNETTLYEPSTLAFARDEDRAKALAMFKARFAAFFDAGKNNAG